MEVPDVTLAEVLVMDLVDIVQVIFFGKINLSVGYSGGGQGLPPFPLSCFASAKCVAFLPSLPCSANLNELAKICQLGAIAHAHD